MFTFSGKFELVKNCKPSFRLVRKRYRRFDCRKRCVADNDTCVIINLATNDHLLLLCWSLHRHYRKQIAVSEAIKQPTLTLFSKLQQTDKAHMTEP